MASRTSQKAAYAASSASGQQLTRAGAGQPSVSVAERLLLADPVSVQVEDGHPLGSNSGMGLTAFYYALILVVSGMLGADVLHSQVDAALGYGHSDVGPWRRQRRLVAASRAHTFAVAATLMLGPSLVMGSLIMGAAVGLLGMDAAHLPQLWLLSVSAVAAVGVGALALLAAFGTPGMLLVTMVFIAMAVPSAGATTPVEALTGDTEDENDQCGGLPKMFVEQLEQIAAIRDDSARLPDPELTARLPELRAAAGSGGAEECFAYADALDRLYRLPSGLTCCGM